MNEAFITVVTIEMAAAFFSVLWPQVEPTQPKINELTAYVPIVKTTMAKYLTPVFITRAPTTKPIMATDFDAVICQVRSFILPEDQDTKSVEAPAIR